MPPPRVGAVRLAPAARSVPTVRSARSALGACRAAPAVSAAVRPGCPARGHADASTLHAARKAQRVTVAVTGGRQQSGLPEASLPASSPASARGAPASCPGGPACHSPLSCKEHCAGRAMHDICDLWDVMAGFSIFTDVSSLLRLGRTFYPSEGFHHRPTREFSQVDLAGRTPFRPVNHGFCCPCDCILLCWLTRSRLQLHRARAILSRRWAAA